jgi:uncharacterized protein (TIGR00369 family)
MAPAILQNRDTTSIFERVGMLRDVDSHACVPFNNGMSEKNPGRFLAALMGNTAFVASLGGEILEIGRGHARTRLPYSAHLVGDPDTGVVHGGVITAMLDQTCGVAVASALTTMMPFATLDLRIDYMKPATPHADILFEAECLKVTHEVAFTRGLAYQSSRDQPIALSTGAFMLIRGVSSGSAKTGV